MTNTNRQASVEIDRRVLSFAILKSTLFHCNSGWACSHFASCRCQSLPV